MSNSMTLILSQNEWMDFWFGKTVYCPVAKENFNGELIKQYGVSLSRIFYWHSACGPIRTSSWTIRLFTNLWPSYRTWPLLNCEWFPWSICNECGKPAGDANPSKHLVTSFFKTCICCSFWDQFFSNLPWFSRLVTLNIPLYVLNFACHDPYKHA